MNQQKWSDCQRCLVTYGKHGLFRRVKTFDVNGFDIELASRVLSLIDCYQREQVSFVSHGAEVFYSWVSKLTNSTNSPVMTPWKLSIAEGDRYGWSESERREDSSPLITLQFHFKLCSVVHGNATYSEFFVPRKRVKRENSKSTIFSPMNEMIYEINHILNCGYEIK